MSLITPEINGKVIIIPDSHVARTASQPHGHDIALPLSSGNIVLFESKLGGNNAGNNIFALLKELCDQVQKPKKINGSLRKWNSIVDQKGYTLWYSENGGTKFYVYGKPNGSYTVESERQEYSRDGGSKKTTTRETLYYIQAPERIIYNKLQIDRVHQDNQDKTTVKEIETENTQSAEEKGSIMLSAALHL